MIEFTSQNEFVLKESTSKKTWIQNVVTKHKKMLGNLSYVFCNDLFLHKLNIDYLDHDTLTDIITFDYTEGDVISGELYISTDRVYENAQTLNSNFEDELDRVMIHGVLHLLGYADKTDGEKAQMRLMEDRCLAVRA